MLPPGITADALAPDDARALRRHFRPARTAARLLIGPCTCDLVLQRDPAHHTEEVALRARCAALGLSRAATIRALDASSAIPADEPVRSPAEWRRALAAFVAEHARNAGPSFYWLGFVPAGRRDPLPDASVPVELTAAEVTAAPDAWLAEDRPVIVGR